MSKDLISKIVEKILNKLGIKSEEYLTPAERVIVDVVKDALIAFPEQHWIPCSQRMPEEREWIGTKPFGTTISDEVYVTFERPDGGRFVKHVYFQNGKLSYHDQLTINAVHKGAMPIAWMPLPDPYGGEE